MTLYLLYGFAKSIEFGVDVPTPMINRAWRYLSSHYRGYYKKRISTDNFDAEFLVFLNYVLSCYPEKSYYDGAFSSDEIQEILKATHGRWRDMSPYCKALLALTLHRHHLMEDGFQVLDSILDSAITREDQGTFWAPEERAWLWYNDTIESHAMILRTVMEMKPDDPRTDGLALWLFLNKKVNHWKSTRVTAEVLYSLVHYLKSRSALAVAESAHVTAGPIDETCSFDPAEYDTGQCRIAVPVDLLKAGAISNVIVKQDGFGPMFASMNWHYSTEKMPVNPRGDFLTVTRSFFRRTMEKGKPILTPVTSATRLAPGDQLEIHLSITSKHPMEYVHLRDPRGAGFEPENHTSGHHWDQGLSWYKEIRDSGTNFFFERLPQGEFTFKYRVRTAMSGTFKIAPAVLQGMYAPEFSAFSAGMVLVVGVP